MAAIDNIVHITIVAGTRNVTQESFGLPLFLAYHTRFAENSRLYQGTDELISDGFDLDDHAYKMAASAWAQDPSLESIRIGRLPTPLSAQTIELDCAAAVAGDVIAFDVVSPDGTVTPISIPFDTDATTTADALVLALDAIAGLTSTNAGGVVAAVADANGPQFFYASVTGPCKVLDVTGDWGYDTQLAIIENESPDFYAVAVDINSAANVSDVAAWCATNGKICGFGPQVTDPTDYTATANALDDANTGQAFSLVKKTRRDSFPECAWLGECLPFAPGSQTWAFKALAGQAPDAWTTSERSTLEADNSNYYSRVKGADITRDGVMHGGTYVDVTRSVDFIEARLQEAVFSLKLNNRKIPFTDDGVQLVVTAVGAVLDLGEEGSTPLLAPGESTISYKTIAQLEASDITNRRMRGIKFRCRLAGAAHETFIEGEIV